MRRLAPLALLLPFGLALFLATVTAPRPAVAEPVAEATGRSSERVGVEDITGRLDAEVSWVKLADLVTGTHESCVDGRDDHTVIGTPGGDAGELVLAIAAMERLLGAPLSEEVIARVVERELEGFGHLYLHTDRHALEHLRDQLLADEATRAYAESLHHALEIPPPHLRERVVAALTQPGNVGCGHLRLMIQNPEVYGVRSEIPRQVVAAVHRLGFDRRPGVRVEVLAGDHAEKAVVVVRVKGNLRPFTRIPMVMPHHEGRQIFVSHPDVTAAMRRLHASHLVETVPELAGRVTEVRLARTMSALGERLQAETLARLAPGLRILEVEVAASGYDVREAGQTPGG